ncbi:hypothetical protein J6590_077533 [Homalodisca vitripennis]|nr:hypothetical protein J6590_077533 [Homalodisca vitripennis]
MEYVNYVIKILSVKDSVIAHISCHIGREELGLLPAKISGNKPQDHGVISDQTTANFEEVSVLVVIAQQFISHNAPAVPGGSGSCVATSRKPVHSIGRRQLHSLMVPCIVQ